MSILGVRTNVRAGRELIGILQRHRQLTWEMTRRELADRYLGQVLGTLWAFVHPAILIGVYIFVFVVVFAVKMGGSYELPLDYTTYMLAGVIPWLTCSETMSKGAVVLVGNANLVKQVVFPLEVLPVKSVLSSFITQFISTALLLCYVFMYLHTAYWTMLLLPMLFLFQVMGLIGLSCILSSVGAYFRDLKDFVQILNVIGIYLMPVVYMPTMVPRLFRPLLYLNPFSYMVWCYQDAIYFGRFEHPLAWLVFPALSLGTFVMGYRLFRQLKLMLGNVL